jgi:hypothetical protein
MKTLLFSKFVLIFGLALASALSVRHFAPSLQQHLPPNIVSAISHSMAVPQVEQPPVNEPDQPQMVELSQDEPSNISIAPVQVSRGHKQFARQSLDDVNDGVRLAIAPVTGLGTIQILGAPPSTEVSDHSTEASDHQAHGNANGRRSPEETNHPSVGGTDDQPPSNVVGGQTNFALISATQPSAPQMFSGPGSNGPLGATSVTDNGPTATPRTVTESDIWKIRGNTLYFFNQLRGLQIIDITNPDAPARIATLSLPAVGEEMYILDDAHVLLLAQDGCSWDHSEVITVTITNGTPAITTRLDVSGYINTSRLVGSALYVASDAYQTTTSPDPTGGVSDVTYIYGTQLTSFDFSDPSTPLARNTLWFDGWNNSAVTATDRFFFVASTTDWTTSAINVVDISSSDGAMAAKGTIQAAGNVADKFKMGLNGDVFTVISEVWDWTNPDNQTVSKLETFSLADPNEPAKLGELNIAAGDQLYATRIEGARAYVVTAFQVDPLWVVDLADPANPKVTGQLEVPGFSTFIQPVGDQLVTLGIVSGQVTVSLFDVHDPAAPAFLSSVAAGGTYSWSEAVWNEKAFSVLPDAGLILVPVSGWDSESGFATQVQLIDLSATSLTVRGIINQAFEPRRATVFGTRILSISSHELLTVDAADRDHPAVTSDVTLAWAVDRVFVLGNYLLEIENGGGWIESAPTFRVASLSDPDEVQSEIHLDGAPILGAALRGGNLYLAQADSQNIGILPLAAGAPTSAVAQPTTTVVSTSTIPTTTDPGSTDTKSTLTVSIYDATQLPQLVLLGKTQTQIDPLGWGASLNALWPKPGLLVWTAGGRNWGPIYFANGSAVGNASAIRGGTMTVPGGADSWWWGGSSQGRLFAFDVTANSSPAFLSEVKFAPDAWSIGDAFSGDGAIYASHSGAVALDGTGTDPGWAEGWFLDVIDFTVPVAPVVRDPVSIPTTLIGVSNATTSSATLFTVGWHVQDQSTSSQFLDASRYDGALATLLDSVALTGWSVPAVADGGNVFVGRSTDNSGGAIDRWTLAGNNKLTLLASAPLGGGPWSLRALGDLLATQVDGQVVLFDKSGPTSLQQIGASDNGSCFYSLNLDGADGDVTRGLWVPRGETGVQPIGLNH